MNKTIITFHFYYPIDNKHVTNEIVYKMNEIDARKEAIEFSKKLSGYFTHITSTRCFS